MAAERHGIRKAAGELCSLKEPEEHHIWMAAEGLGSQRAAEEH
jgi:hypothetical protein